METPSSDRNLDQISTLWPVLFRARHGADATRAAAQETIFKRYGKASRRYLVAATGDAHAADDLFQDFAVRFLRGDFRQVVPERGRFRDYLKQALYHLVIDHQRRQRREPLPLQADLAAPATGSTFSGLSADHGFLADWRATLLERTWTALARWERHTGRPLHTILHYRARHPDIRSPQMAEHLARQLGKPVTAGWVRKELHLARQKFTELLLDEIAQTLSTPTAEELEQEMLELGLHDYCKDALRRWRAGPPGEAAS